jgi:hypothetical protein
MPPAPPPAASGKQYWEWCKNASRRHRRTSGHVWGRHPLILRRRIRIHQTAPIRLKRLKGPVGTLPVPIPSLRCPKVRKRNPLPRQWRTFDPQMQTSHCVRIRTWELSHMMLFSQQWKTTQATYRTSDYRHVAKRRRFGITTTERQTRMPGGNASMSVGIHKPIWCFTISNIAIGDELL